MTWLTNGIFSNLGDMPVAVVFHQIKKKTASHHPQSVAQVNIYDKTSRVVFAIQLVGHPCDFCKLQTLKQATFPLTEASGQHHLGWLLTGCLSLRKYNEKGNFCICCTSSSRPHLLGLKTARQIMRWHPMARRRLLIAVIRTNHTVQNMTLNLLAVNVIIGKKLFQTWSWPVSCVLTLCGYSPLGVNPQAAVTAEHWKWHVAGRKLMLRPQMVRRKL